MITTCLLFPGQGIGLQAIFEKFRQEHIDPTSHFELTKETLCVDLAQITCSGIEQELLDPEYAQLLTYIYSYLVFCNSNIKLDDTCIVVGHSLGEYAALAVANSISFEEGLKMVSARAKTMKEVASGDKFLVLTIENIDLAKVIQCIKTLNQTAPILSFAAIYSPVSCSISGPESQINQLERLLISSGGSTQRLPLLTPVHSILLQDKIPGFQVYLNLVEFRKPSCLWVSNYDGKITEHPDEIRNKLALQFMHPVRWDLLVNALWKVSSEIRFIDFHPTGFLKRLCERSYLHNTMDNKKFKDASRKDYEAILEYLITDIVCTKNQLQGLRKYNENVVLPFHVLKGLLENSQNSDHVDLNAIALPMYIKILKSKGLGEDECVSRLRAFNMRFLTSTFL